MRKSLWILACLLIGGCAIGNGDPGYPASGNKSDAATKSIIKPQQAWEDQCWLPTQDELRKRVKNPKTARFDETPSYEAYYDRARDKTVLVISGVVVSKGNYGQVYRQDFYVTWDQPGNLLQQPAQADAWSSGEVTIHDPVI